MEYQPTSASNSTPRVFHAEMNQNQEVLLAHEGEKLLNTPIEPPEAGHIDEKLIKQTGGEEKLQEFKKPSKIEKWKTEIADHFKRNRARYLTTGGILLAVPLIAAGIASGVIGVLGAVACVVLAFYIGISTFNSLASLLVFGALGGIPLVALGGGGILVGAKIWDMAISTTTRQRHMQKEMNAFFADTPPKKPLSQSIEKPEQFNKMSADELSKFKKEWLLTRDRERFHLEKKIELIKNDVLPDVDKKWILDNIDTWGTKKALSEYQKAFLFRQNFTDNLNQIEAAVKTGALNSEAAKILGNKQASELNCEEATNLVLQGLLAQLDNQMKNLTPLQKAGQPNPSILYLMEKSLTNKEIDFHTRIALTQLCLQGPTGELPEYSRKLVDVYSGKKMNAVLSRAIAQIEKSQAQPKV